MHTLFNRFKAIGPPIFPRPINPTCFPDPYWTAEPFFLNDYNFKFYIRTYSRELKIRSPQHQLVVVHILRVRKNLQPMIENQK